MTQGRLFVLFEHATGYSLFEVKEFEEVLMFNQRVEQAVDDPSRFMALVKMVAFSPFTTHANALDNINSLSEGVIHDDLRLFIQTNLPSSSKKGAVLLGVADQKLAANFQEEMGISCKWSGVVPEVTRGIRLHFCKFVKKLPEASAIKAQNGLGHSYSRSKVKFNVHRVDNMIIQSIALLDQLDKDINKFAMRLREWYSYHFPELIRIVNDNYLYARCVQLIKSRKEMDDAMFEQLEAIIQDTAKTKAVFDVAKSSMGMDISPIDVLSINHFASRVIALADYRRQLQTYLLTKMHAVAPNLATLIGEQVGARLIAHAGSLTSLAKYPASTVQILGAEKALFRALKTRGNTPKYGLIFHSTFIGRAAAKNKGRISRYLANKCSIAARVDCFSDAPCDVFGHVLRQQVEDRLKFYETGDVPRTNAEAMQEAIEQAKVAQEQAAKKLKKKKKKHAKEEAEDEQGAEAAGDECTNGDTLAESATPKGKKHKRARAKEEPDEAEANGVDEPMLVDESPPKSEKKKHKRQRHSVGVEE